MSIGSYTNVFINNTVFWNNYDIVTQASTLSASDSSTIYMKDTVFQYNVGGIGGAVSLRRSSKLRAIDSYFNSNIAQTQAGVLSVDQYCEAWMDSCYFEDNIAIASIAVLKSNKADDI